MSYLDNKCDICGSNTFAFSRYYENAPFVDGRFYPFICFTCLVAQDLANGECCKLDKLISDGFNKSEAVNTITSINVLLKTKLKYVDIFSTT